uniref:Putative mrr restriction protein n=1 Tax=Crocosphaera subtropica (strain ATCC 51142 / BH68) TaxID=43989 RepID=A1KYH2_CROS5|nr:putative mrr restriction protein [Crocosphaera subtropica ATCC 51142]
MDTPCFAVECIYSFFNLTHEERKQLLPSGKQAIFDNRVGWAKTYFKKADLLESTKWGYFKITQKGKKVLNDNSIQEIDAKFLKQFPEFIDFTNNTKKQHNHLLSSESDQQLEEIEDNETPQEQLGKIYLKIREELKKELLENIKQYSPNFFEKLVIDLLIAMGYGGSRKEAGEAVGQVNDGGIDGIIKEDRLGLDIIYIQAKRWENTVGRPEIQKFAGALLGKQAKQGIFITTSNFSKEAIEYITMIDSEIILIDGERLSALLIDYNVGVSLVESYAIKKIDNDYFTE